MANNFWSEYNRLKKKNGEEAVIFDAPVRETATSSTVSSDSFLADSGASFWDEYERQKTVKESKAAREAEEKAQKEAEAKAKKEAEEKAKATEDIAPVKHGGGGGSFGESKTTNVFASKALSDPDYAKYAQQGASLKNPSYWDSTKGISIAGWRPFGEDIVNPVTFVRENEAAVRLEGNQLFSGIDYLWSNMTDDEVSVYNYYLAKYGKDKAKEYLDSIEDELSAREGKQQADMFNGNAVAEVLIAGGAGTENALRGLTLGMKNLVTGSRETLQKTPAQYADELMAQDNEGLMKITHDTASAIGNMIPSIAVGILNPAAGAATMAAGVAGNKYSEMIGEGNDVDEARGSAILNGVLEGGLQYAMGGISKLGGTGASKLFSKVAPNVASKISETVAKAAASSPRIMQAIGHAAKEMGKEATEEALQTVLEPLVDSWVTGEEFEAPEFEDVVYSALLGAITSGVLEGAPAVGNSVVDTVKNPGVNAEGYTKDEQSVIDRVTEDIVAEKEKEGEKLTFTEKQEIADRVKDDLEKGYLSTDTIEEVLGGEEYQAYTEAVAKEDELRKEYEELGALEHPTLAQKTRFEELHGTRDSFTSDDTRNALREKMQANVRDRIKDSRLNESYLERSRRGQYFADDASSYTNENARKTIENLVGSKLANNTRRTRELADTVTKIAEDKGITFDFTNNEKIKADGRAYISKKDFTADGNAAVFDLGAKNLDADFKPVVTVGGEPVSNFKVDYASGTITFDAAPSGDIHVEYRRSGTVNGFYDKKNRVVTVNMDSPKAWQFIVGHEVTHSLEGTAEYGELQSAIKRYAEMKGDYSGRWDSLTSAYNAGTDIEGEITSDLVGEYLFTDEAFVQQLSTENRNLFQRIYDEIKHLYKMVTAGSKEARELERVKHAFEKAYRAQADAKAQKNTANNGDVVYSVAEIVDQSGKSYGIGVKLDSTLLDDLTPEERVEMVKLRVSELGGQHFVAYDASGNATDIIIAEPSWKFKNKNGKRTSVNKDLTQKNILNETKQEAVVLANEMIEASQYSEEEKSRYPHGWLDNDGKNNWEYWTTYIEDKNNNIWLATLNVATSANGERILYDINQIKKVGRSVKSDTLPTATSIPQNSEMSSTNSKKVSENIVPIKEQNSLSALEDSEINKKLGEVGVQYDAKTETVSYSLGSLEDAFNYHEGANAIAIARSEYVDDLVKATGKSREEANRYLDSLFLVHDMIAEDRDRLDYDPAENRTAWVSNSEYGGSIDFSTLCAKRRLFTGTFDAIQSRLPDTVLNENDFLKIRNLLLEHGEESPCSMCYVEGSRAKHGVYVDKWLKEYLKTNPEWKPQLADFTSSTRLEKTRIQHPEAYAAYQKAMNSLAQRNPKEASVRTDYKGEILRDFKDSSTVSEKNKNGGVRFNSFSDFEIIHALDCMQVITDMARVGLNGQAYTKVKDFAEAFGNTGLKINLSLVAKDVDANGKLVMDEINGMNYEEAMDIRSRFSENVGTVIVVFNDEQIRAALADDTIDYVIPFHRSQWKKAQYAMMGLPAQTKDYTMVQNDRATNPKTGKPAKLSKLKKTTTYTNDVTGETFEIKDNIMPNQYWDFSKSGRDNAQRYLDYINENGMTPKFDSVLEKVDGKWVLPSNEVGDGYFKLLIDFKMYDNDGWGAPQNPVLPEFNMPYIQEMLDNYVGGHESFPVAHDVVEKFVKEKSGKYSLSTDIAPISGGNWRTPAHDLRYEGTAADIAPVNDQIGKTNDQIDNANEIVDSDNAKEDKSAKKITRRSLHQSIIEGIKEQFSSRGYDFDTVLKNAKDLSTFATVDNTPQRVMEKSLGYKEGGILADATVNKVAQNESKAINWLNSFTDKKNGVLAQLSRQYRIKPGSKESAAAQMYAEGFYVNSDNEIIAYGDAELAKDFPDVSTQARIKGLARDPRIRSIYDETLEMINESRERNAYPEITRLDNYFLHFRAMEDTFSKLGLPFNPNDIRAKDLPTDINGVTADLKPGQPFFASSMHRRGQRTSFDLLGGMEKYLSSAKNQIFHIDDIQTLRAIRNYIADAYGQAKGLDSIDTMSEEEAQERIKDVYGAHLSTFAKFLNEEANVIAGKTSLTDRGLEGIIGRRGIAFLDSVNRQVGANMVGFNVSSSLTNILPVVQTLAKGNKAAFVKAFAQTVSNKLGGIVGRSDGFAEESPVIVRRKGADRFYRTPWQKMADLGYVLMGAVDSVSTEIIARTKYNELVRRGMPSEQAHIEADKWTSRLMGDRSLGQQPHLYNSKMLGLLTKFQLEVRNQLDSQFYDTIQEAKVSTEDIENALARNAKTAAKVASTFVQLAVAQHIFGKVFESITGYNPAFDIIEAIVKAFGWDEEEDNDDTVLDNIEQGFLSLLGDLPYTSTLTGGRIPISSAMPISEFFQGKDQYGNEKSRLETLAEAAPYYLLPGGYGQIKKTVQGLSMFSDEHPVSGSYTDSGNLRFPVEDTIGNRAQAALFGQWASANARDYFDNERKPLTPKQIEEYKASEMTIGDYWDYREGLSGLSTIEDKAAYINSLDIPLWKKNFLINNLSDRKEKISMKDYATYGSIAEADFAKDNPDRYKLLKQHGVTYAQYQAFDDSKKNAYTWAAKNPEKYDFIRDIGYTIDDYADATDDEKEAWTWAYNNPEKYVVSQAVSDDLFVYRWYTSDLADIKADKDAEGKSISGSRKAKVIDYINGVVADYGAKLILFKSEYPSDDTYNSDIIDYLNSREDITYEQMVTILTELGFKVSGNNVTW